MWAMRFIRISFSFSAVFLATVPRLATDYSADPSQHKRYLQMAKTIYDRETKSIEIAIPTHLDKPIKNAIRLLFERSGEPATEVYLRITNDPGMNAKTYVGPYFVITKGLLDALDAEAQKRFERGKTSNHPHDLDYYRENLVAGVMGHEMGHFLAGHGLRAIAQLEKKMENLTESAVFELLRTNFRNSQDGEFEADRLGFSLIEKAGYDPQFMYAVLAILNAETQGACEKSDGRDCRPNSFLSTHPSGHARLAKFRTDEQGFHESMARIEQAVAAIELGVELPFATAIIEAELKTNKHNAYFQRVHAIALHKAWLTTVKFEDQKMRVILNVPTFYDKLANKPTATRKGEKKVPGSTLKYLAAVKAYRASFENPQRPDFVSGFAVLLAYDTESETLADQLSSRAVLAETSATVLNNRAIVLFLNGNFAEAGKILDAVASEINKNLGKIYSAAQRDPKLLAALQRRQTEIYSAQAFDKGYLRDEQTPILNLALYAYAANQKTASSNLSKHFLQTYDSTSAWAKFLAKINGIALQAPTQNQNSIESLQVGSSLNAALKKFGKPVRVVKVSEDATIYYLQNSQIRLVVQAGAVRGFTISGNSAAVLNDQLRIGASRGEVEKILGSTARSAQGYALYGTEHSVKIRYDGDKIVEFGLE